MYEETQISHSCLYIYKQKLRKTLTQSHTRICTPRYITCGSFTSFTSKAVKAFEDVSLDGERGSKDTKINAVKIHSVSNVICLRALVLI